MTVADPPPPDDNLAYFIEPGADVTEDLGALMFARRYQGQLAYCHTEAVWREYDGSVWRTCETPLAFHYARELARKLSVSARGSKATLQRTNFAKGVEAFARADPIFARTAASWDADPWLMGTPAGTIDLHTGELITAQPSHGITRATAVQPAKWANCPIWLEFLRQATDDDEELVGFLQRLAGYSLTGTTTEHALFFVYGPGGNGKSVFLNTLTHILADYAATAAMDTFTAQSRTGQIPVDLAMLRGARLVTASETSEGKKWDQQRVAQVTGGDPITARFMRQNFFTYSPQFSLIIVGNHKPSLQSVDDAMRRRFNIIPFLIKPDTPDRDLEAKLRDEWPAILKWMIDGCLEWQRRGLDRPRVVAEATDDYFDEQNTMQQWLEQDCEVDLRNWHLAEKSGKLFDVWARFAKSNGEDAGTSKTFKPAMEKLGFRFKKDMSGRWFHGVRLRPKDRDDDLAY